MAHHIVQIIFDFYVQVFSSMKFHQFLRAHLAVTKHILNSLLSFVKNDEIYKILKIIMH